MTSRRGLWVVAAIVSVVVPAGYVASRMTDPASDDVEVLELPRGGSLPYAASNGSGTLHVAFMVGQDVFYAKRDGSKGKLGAPVRVNEMAGVALGGMFRGPELAIAGDGAVDVIWYRRGFELKLPAAEQGPMFSRQVPGGGFGPATTLFDRPTDGHSLVATKDGLLAAWVAGNSLWARSSRDAGATFQPAEDLGALPCECCDTALAAGSGDDVFLVYRDRVDNLRDVYLVQIRPETGGARRLRLDSEDWRFNACPMSGMSLARHDGGLFAVWEHKGSILLTDVDTDRWSRRAPILVSASGKYPVAATDGKSLLVGWKQRKDLVWKLYDRTTLQVLREGRVAASTSNRPAAVARGDGTFTLIP